MAKPKVRTGMPSMQLNKSEFFARARARFYDPTFAAVVPEIEKIIEVAWKNYTAYRKSPRTRRAGRGFSDPNSLCRWNGSKPAASSTGWRKFIRVGWLTCPMAWFG